MKSGTKGESHELWSAMLEYSDARSTVTRALLLSNPGDREVHARFTHESEWGLCALRDGIQTLMEAILACHPARSTEWTWMAKWCEVLQASLVPCAQQRYGPLAFLTPFVFLLIHRLVTCPFSVKLSPSATGCLLLLSLLRLSLLFGQRFDSTLSRICSAMVSLCSFPPFFS